MRVRKRACVSESQYYVCLCVWQIFKNTHTSWDRYKESNTQTPLQLLNFFPLTSRCPWRTVSFVNLQKNPMKKLYKKILISIELKITKIKLLGEGSLFAMVHFKELSCNWLQIRIDSHIYRTCYQPLWDGEICKGRLLCSG